MSPELESLSSTIFEFFRHIDRTFIAAAFFTMWISIILKRLGGTKLVRIIEIFSPALAFLGALFTLADQFSIIKPLVSQSREMIIISTSLLVVLACIAITVYFNPSRMTVVAGVSLGFIGAALLVEGFLELDAYIEKRINAEKSAKVPAQAIDEPSLSKPLR
jgi:hypothetical protein